MATVQITCTTDASLQIWKVLTFEYRNDTKTKRNVQHLK